MTDSVSEGVSYLLTNLTVCQYRDEEYLCMGKSGSSIDKIDDVVEYEPKDKLQCNLVIVVM